MKISRTIGLQEGAGTGEVQIKTLRGGKEKTRDLKKGHDGCQVSGQGVVLVLPKWRVEEKT